jgi:hypothetical protein
VFQVTALWLASGQIPATTLGVLINEHQVGFDDQDAVGLGPKIKESASQFLQL